MEGKPLFSILIANYNNGRFINDAIESVYAQIYTNWEIIIVDDFSTDNSFEIYRTLSSDNRIHIYYNDKNYGCGYTKRRCVELATGEICGFLDPDDVLLPNALSSTFNVLIKYPETSIVLSRHYVCDANLQVLRESRLLMVPEGKTYFTNRDYHAEVFAAFRKCAYNRTLGIDSTLVLGVDQDLYFKMEEVGVLRVLDEFTYKYRGHGKNISSDPSYSLYWNIVARHNTCIRRGLSPREYSYFDAMDYLHDMMAFSASQKEESMQNMCLVREETIRHSLSFRIGHTVLQPFKFLRNFVFHKLT